MGADHRGDVDRGEAAGRWPDPLQQPPGRPDRVRADAGERDARDGITVNCVLPGFTRTDRVVELAQATAARDGVPEAEVYAKWEREIPMGRIGEVAEFAAMVAFLASERASYITGQSIAVDGGWIRSLV